MGLGDVGGVAQTSPSGVGGAWFVSGASSEVELIPNGSCGISSNSADLCVEKCYKSHVIKNMVYNHNWYISIQTGHIKSRRDFILGTEVG